MASEPPPLPSSHPELAPPPAMPPPVVPSSPSPLPASEPLLAGRLHPLTLLFAAWSALRSILIPLLIVLFVGPKTAETRFALYSLMFIGLPVGFAVVKYLTFRYRLQGGELITTQGLLGRTQRNIPLTRVQDIRLEQGVLHRLFRVTEVHVETAGGQGAEASLSVLSLAEAERFRSAIFAQRHAALSASTDAAALLPEPAREVIKRLSLGELVLAGLTSNQMASALAVVFVLWGLLDDFIPQKEYERFILRASEAAAVWYVRAGSAAWIALALGAVLLVILGMLFSVIGSVVVFYGFTLSRAGEDLHRAYGLLTRRASSLARRRIQVLKIEETWLRRLFGLATIHADSAGSKANREEGTGGRDVMLPVVPRRELAGFLSAFFPLWESVSDQWRRVSPRAIRRGTTRGTLLCLVLALLSWVIQREWLALWPLGLIPVVYWANVLSYRHLGYALGEHYFQTRRGWLRRTTHIVPIRNAQSIVLRQTPWDRRHGVMTLRVDTAGQAYTGGAPEIGNVPASEALELARALARQAAVTRYRW